MENKSNVYHKIDETVKNTLNDFEATYNTADWVKIELALSDSSLPSAINPLNKINLPNLLENVPSLGSFKNVRLSYLAIGAVVVLGIVILVFSMSKQSDNSETDIATPPPINEITKETTTVKNSPEQPVKKDTIETVRNTQVEESSQIRRQRDLFNKKADGQQVEEIGLTEPRSNTTVVKRKRIKGEDSTLDVNNAPVETPANNGSPETNIAAQPDAPLVLEQVAAPSTADTARPQEVKKTKERKKQKKQPAPSDSVPQQPTTLKELGN